MSTNVNDKAIRWITLGLLLLGVGVQVWRITHVRSKAGEMPFFSANDRSRWCTIAALSIGGTYEIDEVLEIRDPQTRRSTWSTIDLVRHRASDGQQHYYSSKPPLLPTLYAGVYWVLRRVTGLSLMHHPFTVAKIMLLLVNLIPLGGLWWIFIRQAVRIHRSDLWAVSVLSVFAVFGTFLSTFANTLNNHLPAAVAVGVSLVCLEAIIARRTAASENSVEQTSQDRRWPQWAWFALCGVATSFAAANELPALSWLVAVGGLLLCIDWRRTLFAYTPALLPVAVAFFVTNFIAHGVWVPAYGHRGVGEKLFTLSEQVQLPPELVQMNRRESSSEMGAETTESVAQVMQELRQQGLELSSEATLQPARRAGVVELWDEPSQTRWGLQRDSKGAWAVHAWDDWYDYPKSYWMADRKQGVDRGEKSVWLYAFHSLIGHHGIFSLTPFWLISVIGVWRVGRQWRAKTFFDARQWLFAAIVVTSLVCIAFYLTRPLEDRNYGGVCSGFRWAFWLAPLWYWLAIEGMRDVKQHKWLWPVVGIALLVSIFSAAYPWNNPWISPWIMEIGSIGNNA